MYEVSVFLLIWVCLECGRCGLHIEISANQKDCHSFPILFMQEIRKRGLKVAVAGIPKTIDNDIPVLSSYIHELLLNQVHSPIIFEN